MLSILALAVAASFGAGAIRRRARGQSGGAARGPLVIATIGFVRILLVFVFQGLLAQMTLPRILGDVLFTLSLIVWAIYRMDVLGVNLAGIVTTSAILGTGVALSLREPLTNLWGGLAVQLDNTYRIGDRARRRRDGPGRRIRWRYTALATNSC
jgi:small-conductance mechanosensitive channel